MEQLDNIDAALDLVDNLEKIELNNVSSLPKLLNTKESNISLENNCNEELQIVDAIKINSMNSTTLNNDNLKYSKHSILPTVGANSNLKLNSKNTESYNCMPNDSKESGSSGAEGLETSSAEDIEISDAEELDVSDEEQTSHTALDTAVITIPSTSFYNEVAYKFVISNDLVRSYILNGKFIDFADEPDVQYNPVDVDMILDDVVIFGEHFYLIKWKNWSRGFHSWEKYNVLYECQDLIFNYWQAKYIELNTKCIDISKNITKQVDGLRLMLSRKIITKIYELYRNETGLSLPIINTDDLTNLLHGLDIENEQVRSNREKTLKISLATVALSYFLHEQLSLFKVYETAINTLINTYKIKVENNNDLEGPPDFFTYSTECILKNISISDDPPIGCNCKNNCESGFCCNAMAGNSAPYNSNKILIVPLGRPIYECNKKCKCTSDCINRVVQFGCKINVCIYKTSSIGWGIKTKQDIRKGQFVSEFVGEVITVEEAEQRLETKSSSLDRMWNLDFNDSMNYKYIIDSSHYANFTYFINHSCSANLNLHAVWINYLDLNLPHLALFANRDILAGEQLTTNYFSRCSTKDLKKTGIRCRCQARNCKGYFF